MVDKDQKRGFYQKYIIEKADGSPIDPQAQYFILRLDTDRAARVALQVYAEEIKNDNPKLSSDLFSLLNLFGGV